MSARRNWRVLAQDFDGAVVDVRVKGTDFDELVIDGFLHLEKTDNGLWCLIVDSLKGERFHIAITEATKRRPARVTIVEAPKGSVK